MRYKGEYSPSYLLDPVCCTLLDAMQSVYLSYCFTGDLHLASLKDLHTGFREVQVRYLYITGTFSRECGRPWTR